MASFLLQASRWRCPRHPQHEAVDVTEGIAGMLLCHVASPRDSATQRIREHMRVVAGHTQEGVTKGEFFRHFFLQKLALLS